MTTVTNGYTDVATLKLWNGVTTTTFDTTLLPAAINAASRAIDNYTQQRFWQDPTPVALTFEPTSLYYLCFEEDGIADASTVTIQTDNGGTGAFATTWAASDYQLQPVNAAQASPEAKPYTGFRAVGSLNLPYLGWWPPLSRRDRVKVTAKWGWPAVPDAITEACLIKAAKLFGRKDSIQGMVAGGSDFGPVRLSTREDADVIGLLHDYRRHGALVA